MNALVLERAGIVLAVFFGTRVWAKWRVARREHAALTTPLVDLVVLETVFAPRAKDGDDPDLLAEMRGTFLHLNRRAYAEEFWNLHQQIVSLYGTLGETQRSTMRRALVRLIMANDRWLQIVGAKAAAEIGVTEAVLPLIAVLELGDAHRFNVDKAEYSSAEAADIRFRQELEQSLMALSDPPQDQESSLPHSGLRVPRPASDDPMP